MKKKKMIPRWPGAKDELEEAQGDTRWYQGSAEHR